MLAPIGSSTSFALSSTIKSKAGYDAELVKLQKELSDCVNCSSAKTAEGKTKIQVLAGKISSIKEQVKVSNSATAVNQPLKLSQGEYIPASSNRYEQASLPIDKYQSLSKDKEGVSIGVYLDVTA
jgi:hypothetical protein